MILAENAAKITTGKESSSGTFFPAYDRLFAPMDRGDCDNRIQRGFAKAFFMDPIDSAFTRADYTAIHI